MKPGLILINTSRSELVDETSLLVALREKRIAGAGIDVFDMEPPLPEDYPLLSAPHTVLTPHVGFDTEEAMERRAAIVADNLKSFVEGKQKNIIC